MAWLLTELTLQDTAIDTAPGVANSQCYFGLDAQKDASGLDAQYVL
jgi:hypothetical protein